MKKRLIFWLTTQRHLELFSLQLSYVLFRYWITGQFLLLHRYNTPTINLDSLSISLGEGDFWWWAPSQHNKIFNPFSLSLSTSILPRGGVVSYLAATVREDWSRKRDSSPRRTRIPNQNNNRIKHTQQLDQSFLCFKKYLDIWWLHNHTYNRKADWRDFYIKRYLRRRTFGVLEGFTANSTSTGGPTGCGTGNFPELTDTKTGPGSSQIAKIAATAQQTLSSAWRQSSSHFDPTRATVGATTGATATGSNAMLLSDPGQLANISNMDLPSVLNQAYSPYGNPYGMYG